MRRPTTMSAQYRIFVQPIVHMQATMLHALYSVREAAAKLGKVVCRPGPRCAIGRAV